MENSKDYYNWNDTLGYQADVTMVIGARGVGKTFGIRAQCVRDFFKDGSRFVEVCRFKDEINDVMDGYFEKLQIEGVIPEDYIFKYERKKGYIAKNPPDKKTKPEWECICYFVALSMMQRAKKKTFVKVKRIILDEAVIEKIDRWHGYLPNEYQALVNIVDSCTREHVIDDAEMKCAHVYLLGNACHLTNPYFIAFGIDRVPPKGKSWWKNKTVLLDYVDSENYARSKIKNTLAGRMGAIGNTNDVAAFNEFTDSNDFIQRKTKNAKFYFGLKYNEQTFGVWIDDSEGLIFITSKLIKNADPIFALTTKDNRINLLMIEKSNPTLKSLVKMHYAGLLRYENFKVQETFNSVLSLMGVL